MSEADALVFGAHGLRPVRLGIFVSDAELGFVHAPLTHQRLDGFTFRTDGNGFRTGEAPERRRPVLLGLGSGGMLGWGVEAERSFAAGLAEALGLTLVNAAVRHGNGAASLLMLRRVSTLLAPELVLYGLSDAHLTRNLQPFADFGSVLVDRPALRRGAGNAWRVVPRSGAFGLWLLNHKEWERGPQAALQKAKWRLVERYRRKCLERFSAPNLLPDAAAANRFIVHGMAAAAGKTGARLAVLYLPSDDRLLNKLDPEFASFCREAGVSFVDAPSAPHDDAGHGRLAECAASALMALRTRTAGEADRPDTSMLHVAEA